MLGWRPHSRSAPAFDILRRSHRWRSPLLGRILAVISDRAAVALLVGVVLGWYLQTVVPGGCSHNMATEGIAGLPVLSDYAAFQLQVAELADKYRACRDEYRECREVVKDREFALVVRDVLINDLDLFWARYQRNAETRLVRVQQQASAFLRADLAAASSVEVLQRERAGRFLDAWEAAPSEVYATLVSSLKYLKAGMVLVQSLIDVGASRPVVVGDAHLNKRMKEEDTCVTTCFARH